MITVLVVINGALGDRVLAALEADPVRFRACRADAGEADMNAFGVNLVVVDQTLGEDRREALVHAYGAPIFAVGEEIDLSFNVHSLQRAITQAAVVQPRSSGVELVAIDPPLQNALWVIERVARRRGAVLITGPTGVGKELLARRLHARSGRKGPLVAINCAAIPTDLAETTLFGHVRGAFTGAVSNAKGAMGEANRGTLFLDEIGDLDGAAQAKLLRAVEHGVIRPVGAERETSVDVRLVAATNRELQTDVARGRFREDLFYRLATFHIAVPALRLRPRDLRSLIDRLHASHDRARRVSISREARDLLESYPWPGNVRELRNVMDRILSLAPPGEISPTMLRDYVPELFQGRRRTATFAPREGGVGAQSKKDLRKASIEAEAQALRTSLASGTQSRQQLADSIGVHRSTLWRRLKLLNIPKDAVAPHPSTCGPRSVPSRSRRKP